MDLLHAAGAGDMNRYRSYDTRLFYQSLSHRFAMKALFQFWTYIVYERKEMFLLKGLEQHWIWLLAHSCARRK